MALHHGVGPVLVRIDNPWDGPAVITLLLALWTLISAFRAEHLLRRQTQGIDRLSFSSLLVDLRRDLLVIRSMMQALEAAAWDIVNARAILGMGRNELRPSLSHKNRKEALAEAIKDAVQVPGVEAPLARKLNRLTDSYSLFCNLVEDPACDPQLAETQMTKVENEVVTLVEELERIRKGILDRRTAIQDHWNSKIDEDSRWENRLSARVWTWIKKTCRLDRHRRP